nr:GGDEF domain-containing protein [Lysobacter sp. GX 14042]
MRQGVDRVEHSYRVLVALNTAQGHLRSAESAARGYRRTGAPALYAELRELVPDVREQAAQLARLTTDNPPQNQRVLQWQELIEYRLQELTALADGETGGASADAALAGDVRAGTTARTSEAATRILEVEEELLLERRAIIDERTGRLTGFVVLGIVLPLVVLTLLLQGLLRENRRSRRLEREARNAALEMEASLVERDRVTEQHRLLGSYTGLLQSCQTLPEAFELTTSLLQHLLPHAGGHCYALDASRNLAEVVATFGTPVAASAEVLSPDDCWALRRGQPHRTDDRHGHVTCRHIDRPTAGSGVWTLCVPLVAQGNSLGLLHASALGNDGRTDNDTALLETVGEQLSLAMVNLQLRESLRQQSLRDPLTGLFNRRYLETSLERELARCRRRGLPVSVLMLDVDHFKLFNDTHGHAAGDALLQKVAGVLASQVRQEDIACRYGGEEFTLVLPETDAAMAMARAEQVRATVAATTITHMGQQLGPATVSIGVASAPVSGNTPGELLEAADAALYRAKAGGRDRVEAA